MEYNENSEPNESETNEETNSMKQWLQDNLRVIISVLIVLIIAGGIYSYSNRSPIEQANQKEEVASIENILGESEDESDDSAKENPKETPKETESPKDNTEKKAEVEKKEQPQVKTEEKKDTVVPVAPKTDSQETDGAFIETAAKGDGVTHLARRALVNYLEKNTDSSLTAEHKIYIEDYLRKHAGQKGSVRIGTSVEFSKSLIQEAISSSKNLNERQLQNLHKYAVRVPSLS